MAKAKKPDWLAEEHNERGHPNYIEGCPACVPGDTEGRARVNKIVGQLLTKMQAGRRRTVKTEKKTEDDIYEAAIDALQTARGVVYDAMKCAGESRFNDEDAKMAWRDVARSLEILIRNAERAHKSDNCST